MMNPRKNSDAAKQRIFLSHFSADFCLQKPTHSPTFRSGTTTHTVKTEDESTVQSTDQYSSESSFHCEVNKKSVSFADAANDDDDALCDIHVIESYRDLIGLWWEEHELQQMKAECTKIVKYHRKDENFCNTVVTVLMQGVSGTESKPDTKTFLDQMRVHQSARGLEPHIVKQSEQLAELHQNAVFEAQEQAYKRGLIGTEKGDWLIRSASVQTSRPFEVLAYRLAKFDKREAMRAAFSRRNSESALKIKKAGNRKRMSRSASVRCIDK